jgi:hypothetical protein
MQHIGEAAVREADVAVGGAAGREADVAVGGAAGREADVAVGGSAEGARYIHLRNLRRPCPSNNLSWPQ